MPLCNSSINIGVKNNPTGFSLSGNNGRLTMGSGDVTFEGTDTIANGNILMGDAAQNAFIKGNLVAGGGIGISVNTGNASISISQTVPVYVPISIGTLTWTNMTAAASFLNGITSYTTFANLSGYTGVRLLVNKGAATGSLRAVVYLAQSGGFGTNPLTYQPIDDPSNGTVLSINNLNTYMVSPWRAITGTALGSTGRFITLIGISGDGALDPVMGSVYAQFM